MKGESMVNGFILIRPEKRDRKAARAPRPRPRRLPRRPLEPLRGPVQADAGHPGRFYLWIVEHLFRDNELILGKLELGGRRVDLKSLRAPLFLLAGAKDHITPPDQVFALAD
jgi:poly(3-hydroxyalkanoate) synthetase